MPLHVTPDHAGVKIEAAAGGTADDDRNRLALVELGGRLGGRWRNGQRSEECGCAKGAQDA